MLAPSGHKLLRVPHHLLHADRPALKPDEIPCIRLAAGAGGDRCPGMHHNRAVTGQRIPRAACKREPGMQMAREEEVHPAPGEVAHRHLRPGQRGVVEVVGRHVHRVVRDDHPDQLSRNRPKLPAHAIHLRAVQAAVLGRHQPHRIHAGNGNGIVAVERRHVPRHDPVVPLQRTHHALEEVGGRNIVIARNNNPRPRRQFAKKRHRRAKLALLRALRPGRPRRPAHRPQPCAAPPPGLRRSPDRPCRSARSEMCASVFNGLPYFAQRRPADWTPAQ